MGSLLNSGNYKAGGTISNYRVLKIDSTDSDELIHTTHDTDEVTAVSTCDATATNPAALTYRFLEPGKKYSINAHAAITKGDYLAPAAAGRVATCAAGDRYFFRADEDAAAQDDVIMATCVMSSHLLA